MSAPQPIAPGLHFVATPIGSARDITLRALDLLAGAEVIAAEDTRTTRHLMQIHGISPGQRPLIAYHDHNGAQVRPKLLEMLREGRSVAYVSDAGTPLVADPGFVLAREAIAAGLPVTSAPGPSALLAALTVAGLPTDRFLFEGFLPAGKSARRDHLRRLAELPATLVFFESPKRCSATLKEMALTLGEMRQAALCRELTKKFEEVRRGTLAELAASSADVPPRGEVVLVVDRDRSVASEQDMETALRAALARLSVKDAAAEVAAGLGLPKRQVYQAALKLDSGAD